MPTRSPIPLAGQTARSHAGLLASELQKFRLLPLVLIEYPDVATALDTGAPAAIDRLNRQAGAARRAHRRRGASM